MLINADQCRSMPINADQNHGIDPKLPLNADHCRSMVIDSNQFQSIPLNANQHPDQDISKT